MAFDIISTMGLARGALQTLSGVTPNGSVAVDMQGFEALTVYMLNGTVTDAGTASGYTAVIQHSDTLVGADFVTCTADQLVADSAGATTITTTLDTADDVIAGGVGYRGGRRYVRMLVTGTSGTNAIVSALFVRGMASNVSQPVATLGATLATT